MHCTGMKEKSLIILSRHSYPLYAGGSIKENFQDWDGKGSSVLLEARVVSTVFTISDLIWKIENAGCYDEGESGSTGPYHVENLIICGKGQINANGFSLAYNV